MILLTITPQESISVDSSGWRLRHGQQPSNVKRTVSSHRGPKTLKLAPSFGMNGAFHFGAAWRPRRVATSIEILTLQKVDRHTASASCASESEVTQYGCCWYLTILSLSLSDSAPSFLEPAFKYSADSYKDTAPGGRELQRIM